MKKTVRYFFTIALMSIVAISFNSCKKFKDGVVEIRRLYMGTLDSYFAVLGSDVEKSGNPGPEVPYDVAFGDYIETRVYFPDKNLRDIGYTEKKWENHTHPQTYESPISYRTPGKGGYFANLGSGGGGNGGGGNGGGGNGGGGGGGGATTAIFWKGDAAQSNMQVDITLNGTLIELSPGNKKMLHGDWGSGSPTCSSQEDCDPTYHVLCNVIRVDITQTNNTWVAHEVNSTKTWSGSFTKTPGCMLIEVK